MALFAPIQKAGWNLYQSPGSSPMASPRVSPGCSPANSEASIPSRLRKRQTAHSVTFGNLAVDNERTRRRRLVEETSSGGRTSVSDTSAAAAGDREGGQKNGSSSSIKDSLVNFFSRKRTISSPDNVTYARRRRRHNARVDQQRIHSEKVTTADAMHYAVRGTGAIRRVSKPTRIPSQGSTHRIRPDSSDPAKSPSVAAPAKATTAVSPSSPGYRRMLQASDRQQANEQQLPQRGDCDPDQLPPHTQIIELRAHGALIDYEHEEPRDITEAQAQMRAMMFNKSNRQLPHTHRLRASSLSSKRLETITEAMAETDMESAIEDEDLRRSLLNRRAGQQHKQQSQHASDSHQIERRPTTSLDRHISKQAATTSTEVAETDHHSTEQSSPLKRNDSKRSSSRLGRIFRRLSGRKEPEG